jgi:hypothetical protein
MLQERALPNYQGTIPYSINSSGTITGYFIDGGGVNHGFVRTN